VSKDRVKVEMAEQYCRYNDLTNIKKLEEIAGIKITLEALITGNLRTVGSLIYRSHWI